MRFQSFRIINFRGIKDTTIHLSKIQNGHINALVGLNESGKTTVLEAIHHFLSNPDLSKNAPSATRRSDKDYQRMLPISARALFNGSIQIVATVEIEGKDWDQIESFLKKEFNYKWFAPIKSFEITHELEFEDTKFKTITNVWSTYFFGKKSTHKNAKLTRLLNDDWLKAAKYVQEMLPKIVYFPSALFQFPDRIILEKPKVPSLSTEPRNDFYCSVLEDVLQSINPALNLETHLLGRANSTNQIDQENLDALLLKIAQHLKNTVFTEWKKIFEHTPDYDFRVTLNNENIQLGLEIKILTEEGIFSINERSAGFRWFFAFIMITRYRLHRKDRVLFLFDEPAANLHPNAQTQLIKSFALLAEDADIIYSTHSHYLINPFWLESTHIVQNSISNINGVNVDDSPFESSISVTPYRQFVGNNPDQYYYYRPIQEALDYSPSPLEFPDLVILVEGKTDFFALKYLAETLNHSLGFPMPNIFPGGGAGSLDALISLLYGWGKNFIILVDSDAAGIKQKGRYESKFEQIVDNSIFTLEDINPNWKNYQIEKLFDQADIENIRISCFPDHIKMNKKQFHMAIQELIFSKNEIKFSQATLDNFIKIINFFEVKLNIKSLV